MKDLLNQYPWINDSKARQAIYYVNLDKDFLDEAKELYPGIEDFINDKDKVQLVYEFDTGL